MIYGICSIMVLFVFLIGYTYGRRVGIKEGYEKGLAYAPLKIKEDTYNDYSCPLYTDQIDNDERMC